MASLEYSIWPLFPLGEFHKCLHARNYEGEPSPHIVRTVHLLEREPSMFLNEREDGALRRQRVDDIGEGLGRTHKLAPPMTCHIDTVPDTIIGKYLPHKWHVDVGRIEQYVAIAAPTRTRHFGEVATRQCRGYLASLRQAVGVYAGALAKDDAIAGTN